MTIKNGDLPAMPVWCGNSCQQLYGLTKREQFAAMAMQGLLVKEDVNINNAARLAVAVADRLLNELEK